MTPTRAPEMTAEVRLTLRDGVWELCRAQAGRSYNSPTEWVLLRRLTPEQAVEFAEFVDPSSGLERVVRARLTLEAEWRAIDAEKRRAALADAQARTLDARRLALQARRTADALGLSA